MKNTPENPLKSYTITQGIALTLSGIALLAFNGFVLSKLWLWFICPAFGLAPIGWVLSMGLYLLIHYLLSGCAKAQSTASLATNMFSRFALTTSFLLWGYVCSLFL
jgi:hypothetical protein